MDNKTMTVFENFKIRKHYDEQKEKWYFSVVDIIAALIGQDDYQKARNYWKVLKNRLKNEGGIETVTNCNQLKMTAYDGKERLTDAADVETLLRLVQSVHSPKAEPIKLWLAKTGYERIEESADPEKSIARARKNWEKHGRSKTWIQRRMMGQETRNKLTDYWKEHQVTQDEEFAILTNIIHQEWSDLTVKEHKKLKGLKSQNLRDHMSEAELIFTALAELSTRQIAQTEQAIGMPQNAKAGKKGGAIAKQARLKLEQETGKKVITGQNFLQASRQIKKLQ
ncbi:MAG: hypothetical protein LBV16_06925 [Elusimicrobiota bacterium]|jgi:hypothetical protein|nr:hypothetical protein [Elusimicrobiota bacterium]